MIRDRALRHRVAGWAMSYHLRTQRVLAALTMAVGQTRPEGVVHRSPYAPLALVKGYREMGGPTSTGSAGSGFDNAMAECLFNTLECEHIDRRAQGHL